MHKNHLLGLKIKVIIWPKIPHLVATNTETSWGLVKNILLCRHKHSWKWTHDPKYPVSALSNDKISPVTYKLYCARTHSSGFVNISWIGIRKHRYKHAGVSRRQQTAGRLRSSLSVWEINAAAQFRKPGNKDLSICFFHMWSRLYSPLCNN